ncbi:MAG: hypothetical protein KDJ37_11025 [Hyphomicrobiaceae bacterium]|nr:hypothetical protein [Hyphomicrobiaceae bacterium]
MLIPERAAQPVGRYAAVRTVSQVMLRLERDSPDAFKVVRDEVLDWVRGKAGKPLPKQAWDGLTFELDDVGAQRVAAAHLEQPKYWAARVDDACKEVAQRTWITEIGLAAEPNGRLMFGCRLVVSARGENPRYQPSIPAFIGQVVGGGRAFLDERLISPTPWVVCSDDDVDHFHRLLSLKSRRADVCAISLGEDDADPASAIISVAAVHRRTLGAAHVAVLTGRAAYMLTDLVGKEFSVFNRAVRTYRPNFDTDADDPRRHPLALPHRISQWQENGVYGSEAFERFLVRSAIMQTVSGGDLETTLPPFSEVRRVAATVSLTKARESGATKDDLLRLYEEDNAKLRAALDEEKALHGGLLTEAEQERDEAQRRVEEARGEAYRLNQRIRTLEVQVKGKAGTAVEPPIPDGLENLKDWADKHLSGSVVLTNRAIRGAKESDYEEPALVYRALLLLRDHYVPMRRDRGDELAKAYIEALASCGLAEAGSITATRRGEQGDEYIVQHNGRKRELDRHFTKGNSRESRHCFRLYFFWDDEDEQVVVGWLTSHLDTRQT